MLRVEADAALLQRSRAAAPRAWWSPRRWAGAATRLGRAGAGGAGRAPLLWANMMLHLAADPVALLQQWQRALAVDGFLMFSTLGPGSLHGLRQAYAAAGLAGARTRPSSTCTTWATCWCTPASPTR